MPVFLAIVFLAIPVIEITLLIKIGGVIGVWPTVALVVLTAVIGAALLREQGMRTLMAAQESLRRNEMPVAELFDGACLLVAGALLLTPGFFTDTIGFLLFIPPLRALMRGWLASWLANRPHTTIIIDGEVVRDDPPRRPEDPRTIEGEYREVEDRRPRREGRDNPGGDNPDGDGPGGDGPDGDAPPSDDSRWGRR